MHIRRIAPPLTISHASIVRCTRSFSYLNANKRTKLITGSKDIPDYPSHARKLYRLEKEIQMTLNPLEEDHNALVGHIREMLGCVQKKDVSNFRPASQQTTELAQKILK